MKNQKGITLVALIITIIVMLILAGVSISLVVGENGVLTQAESTKVANVKGALRDAINMANGTIVADFYSNTAGQNRASAATADQLKTYISKEFSGSSAERASISVTNLTLTGTALTGTADVSVKSDDAKVGTVTLKVDLTRSSATSYVQFSSVTDTAN